MYIAKLHEIQFQFVQQGEWLNPRPGLEAHAMVAAHNDTDRLQGDHNANG